MSLHQHLGPSPSRTLIDDRCPSLLNEMHPVVDGAKGSLAVAGNQKMIAHFSTQGKIRSRPRLGYMEMVPCSYYEYLR